MQSKTYPRVIRIKKITFDANISFMIDINGLLKFELKKKNDVNINDHKIKDSSLLFKVSTSIFINVYFRNTLI